MNQHFTTIADAAATELGSHGMYRVLVQPATGHYARYVAQTADRAEAICTARELAATIAPSSGGRVEVHLGDTDQGVDPTVVWWWEAYTDEEVEGYERLPDGSKRSVTLEEE